MNKKTLDKMTHIIVAIIIIIIIVIVILQFILKRNKPACNGYIGINTECEYCKMVKGEHYHFLDNVVDGPFYDMKSTGVMCSYCADHPGEKHYHENCT